MTGIKILLGKQGSMAVGLLLMAVDPKRFSCAYILSAHELPPAHWAPYPMNGLLVTCWSTSFGTVAHFSCPKSSPVHHCCSDSFSSHAGNFSFTDSYCSFPCSHEDVHSSLLYSCILAQVFNKFPVMAWWQASRCSLFRVTQNTKPFESLSNYSPGFFAVNTKSHESLQNMHTHTNAHKQTVCERERNLSLNLLSFPFVSHRAPCTVV